jgi:hypothetical protein
MTKVCHPKISREMDDDAIFKITLFMGRNKWNTNTFPDFSKFL